MILRSSTSKDVKRWFSNSTFEYAFKLPIHYASMKILLLVLLFGCASQNRFARLILKFPIATTKTQSHEILNTLEGIT